MDLRKFARAPALWAAAALAAAGLGAAYWSGGESGGGAAYRTARLDRGAIVASVNATGTVNPVTTVLVGAEISGRLVELLADFNTPVKAGQVVARLDATQIAARLDSARADLAQARAELAIREAQVERTRADIDRARAQTADARAQLARNEALLADAERTLERQRDLQARGVAATATLDGAQAQARAQRASRESARAQIDQAAAQQAGLAADLRLTEAQVLAARAQVAGREAFVRQVEVDLERAEIRSPVDGVVVQRAVELGQTVAASLQAPTLFTIASDLTKIEIYANVDEGDVGRVRAGNDASFTVNAYPGRTFQGRVKNVRLGSQTIQNVVIYTAVVAAENPDLALLPGMTVNLRIVDERRDDVLRAPAAALRWRPQGSTAAGGAPEGGNPFQAIVERGVRDFADQIRNEVKPTADQQRQIDAILADMRAQLERVGASDLPPEQRRQRFVQLRQQAGERIAGLLTPEQRPAFDAIRRRAAQSRQQGQAGVAGRLWVVGANGEPEAVPVRLGASDGNFTEILAGAVEAGREVIVGGGPRPGASVAPSTGPFGPRMF
ncbi:MAG: efflux RND transporter periplasmic adaptor subunit [Azospirillum sp.]|nr:efflux RND transporter periplasmic adaptor subunit [Azospirillum sp.]